MVQVQRKKNLTLYKHLMEEEHDEDRGHHDLAGTLSELSVLEGVVVCLEHLIKLFFTRMKKQLY